MKQLRPTLFLSLSIAILAPAGACSKRSSGDDMPPATGKGAPPREKLPPVEPAVAADKARTGTEQTTGTTFPLDRAEMAPNFSGIIDQVLVEEGEKVAKGQILYRMRTSDLSLRVDQAQAQLRSAQVALDAARVEYQRQERLLEQKAIEQAQFDRVKAQYDSAVVGVEQAKVARAMSRRGMADAFVRSPIGGVVTQVLKNAGEMATMMPPTVVVVIEDQSTIELRFRLPESALSALKPGDTVTAEFESIKAERAARVNRMSPALDMRSRTFEVIATIDNKDGSLRSGMLALVKLGQGKAAPAPQPARSGRSGE
jgi:RND family efflux transporter MFP subunit